MNPYGEYQLTINQKINLKSNAISTICKDALNSVHRLVHREVYHKAIMMAIEQPHDLHKIILNSKQNSRRFPARYSQGPF